MNLKKIIQFSIGPLGAALLSIITLPFVTWFFSVEDVGRLTMLQVILGLSVSLFSLSMHQAYVREYNEEKDKQLLLKHSIIPGLVLLIFFTLITFLIPVSISKLIFDIDSGFLTFMLFIGVFSSFLINFLMHVIRMQERGLIFSIAKIAPKVFFLLCIGIIFILHVEPQFKVLMFINTFSVVVTLFVLLILTYNEWVDSIRTKIQINKVFKMLGFSLPLVIGGLAYTGLTTVDRFFIKDISGLGELGVYALTASLVSGISILSTLFSNIWHPIVYKWVKEGLEQEKIQVITENMLLIITSIWAFVGCFSFLIPMFFPKGYASVEYLILGCISMPLFYMLSQVTGLGIGVVRRSSFAMIASILAFFINVVLNIYLIPTFGAGGASLSTLISFFIFFIVRTESSAFLWISLPRFKMYFVLLIYTTFTFFVIVNKGSVHHLQLIWLLLLILTLFIYSRRFFISTKYIVCFIKEKI